jgi:hypothetical protein
LQHFYGVRAYLQAIYSPEITKNTQSGADTG